MSPRTSNQTSDFLRTVGVRVTGPLGALASVATILIMIVVTIDVFSRNLGGKSIPGLLEMSESALVATVFLGLAYTGVTNGHVSVDLVTAKLPVSVSRTLTGVVWLIGSLMVTWFVYACYLRALSSTQMGEVTRGLMEWPVWPARWLLVIGYLAFLLVALINTYLSFRGEPLLGEEDEQSEEMLYASTAPGSNPHEDTPGEIRKEIRS